MAGPRRRTIRTRLTVLYGTLFLVSGTILLTIVYLLVGQSLPSRLAGQDPMFVPRSGQQLPVVPPSQVRSEALYDYTEQTTAIAQQELLLWSAVCLAVLAILSVGVGWLVAGHVLQPLNRISATARRLSSENLHERIRMDGPRDELTELAATFDGMLDRLQTAFNSQRRFAANASHELRTPLAVQRTAIQVGLEEGVSGRELVLIREQLLDANRRSERIIEGLLLLARSDRGLEREEPVPLHELAAEVVSRHWPEAAKRRIDVRLDSTELVVVGDPTLLAQLLGNLVQNAIRHNIDGGSLLVRVDSNGVLVTNTGTEIDPLGLPALLEPFHRGNQHRRPHGVGLGLSIVCSITKAHGGELRLRPRSGGGLEVTVRFERP